jgi:hypothetical protein
MEISTIMINGHLVLLVLYVSSYVMNERICLRFHVNTAVEMDRSRVDFRPTIAPRINRHFLMIDLPFKLSTREPKIRSTKRSTNVVEGPTRFFFALSGVAPSHCSVSLLSPQYTSAAFRAAIVVLGRY